MIENIGSEFGCHYLDLDLVPEGSTIISAGLGNEISFDESMIEKKGCFIVGIDPTKIVKCPKNTNSFKLIKKIFYGINKKMKISSVHGNGNSIYKREEAKEVETITIHDLLKEYNNISVLKMDIEGAEYSVIDNLEGINIPQITVEFHYWNKEIPFKKEDAEKCIIKMETLGYKLMNRGGFKSSEFLFIKETAK